MQICRKQTKKWTTKDGRRLRICDMDDNHITNTVSMLQRKGEAQRIHNSIFYATRVGPQGDMAQLVFDQECDTAWDATLEDYLPDIYGNLIADMERRELDIPTQEPRLDIEIGLIAKHSGIHIKEG